MTSEELEIRRAGVHCLDRRKLFVVRSVLQDEGMNPDEMVAVLSDHNGQLMLFPDWELRQVAKNGNAVIAPKPCPTTSPG